MKDTGGFDLAAGWASAGMAAKMTRPGQEPMFQPAAFFDLQGANTIAGAIGTALFQRERSGVPTEVDVSLLGVGIWTLSPDIMAGPYVGSMPGPDRTSSPNPLTNSYPTSDGRWLYLVCLQADRFWAELCETIGRPELISDERYADMVVRAQNAKACVAELESTFVSETLGALAQAAGRFHRRLGAGAHAGRGARARAGRGQRVPARGRRARRLHLPAPRASDAVRRRAAGAGADPLPSWGSTPRRSCSNWVTIGTPSATCASPAHSVERGAEHGATLGALNGKIAVITGASSGSGLGVASRFVEEGATVLLLARGGERLVRDGEGPWPRAVPFVTDVGDPDSVGQTFAEMGDRFGRIDISSTMPRSTGRAGSSC